MIQSLREYTYLMNSDLPQDYHRLSDDVITDKLCFRLMKKSLKYRIWLGANHHLSLEVLRFLARDKNIRVRWRIAQKKNLDRELLDLLSKDPDEGVRQRIICNPKTPLDILERFMDDEWDDNVEVARRRLAERRSRENQ